MVTGQVNGGLNLTGPLAEPLLAGTLVLGPMDIRLPGGAVDVEEVDIRNPSALPKQPWQGDEADPATQFAGDALKLDVTINAPSRVFVRGRGVETEMRGEVTITGNAERPAIDGKLRTVRGTYTLLDRQLDISEGVLTFQGDMPPSPYVNVLAETSTDEFTAGVKLEGSVSNPQLTLTSTPSRPQDEIMAQLLFGRDLSSITPFQGVQLVQALRSLNGSESSFDLLGETRDLLGVDRLNVGEMGENDAIGVEAGKYVTDKVYIGVAGGADAEAGKVKAEIELSPRFSVETETGGRASGARLNWKRDY